MHFAGLTVPFVALLATAQALTVRVYNDGACKRLSQTITYTKPGAYQCHDFNNLNAQSAIISTDFAPYGFMVWDSQYCAGLTAGGLPAQLGKCLSAANFGFENFKSAHISPRNTTRQ